MSSSEFQTEPRSFGWLVRYWRLTVGLLAVALFAIYAWRLGATTEEVFRFVLGSTALWGPFGAIFYLLLRGSKEYALERFTLAAVSSYALTTLCYFGCATLGARLLFIGLQVAAVVAASVLLTRRWQRRGDQGWGMLPAPDWLLALLVGLSLLSTLHYKLPFTTLPGNDGTPRTAYVVGPDNLLWTGMAYQLAQGLPPPQCSTRGGSPERAYHHFSVVTCVLLADYTGQSDRLRVHLAYHYTVVEVLMCLGLFGLARRVTGVRWPGYAAIAMLYLLPFEGPELAWSKLHLYYCTFLPQATSGLIPVASITAKTYCSLAVMYGVLLATMRAWHSPDSEAVIPAALAVITSAAMLRFHAPIFLVLFPCVLILAAVLSWRRRRPALAPVTVVALLVVGCLYFEMKNSAYLPGTAAVSLGYNALADWPFVARSWPFADALLRTVSAVLPDGPPRRWTRELLVASGFTIFDIIGFPLLGATGLCLASREIRHRFGLPGVLLVVMVAGSLVLGTLFRSGYYPDASPALHFLAHTRWYLLPFAPVVVWLAGRYLFARCPRSLVYGMTAALCVALVACQFALPPCGWWEKLRSWHVAFEPEEWLALTYLREHTAPRAVIMSDHYLDRYNFVISGLAGRAAYIEPVGNPVDAYVARLAPSDDRAGLVRRLWSCADEETFRTTLLPTPTDYLLEFAEHPLRVRPQSCLTLAWSGPAGRVRIWSVNRRSVTSGDGTLQGR